MHIVRSLEQTARLFCKLRLSRVIAVGRVLRREDRICSRMGASFVEKIAFARGWARPSSRRSHLLEDGRVLRREDRICSRMGASFVEKIAFARGWARPSSSICHLLVIHGIQSHSCAI